MKIAIAGTRGVPPAYGGFETFAAELGTRLVARGHDVTVYCRSNGGQAPPPVRDAPDDRRGRLSSTGMWNGIQRIVAGATHTSLVFEAKAVKASEAAICQVLEAVRTGKPLAAP